MLVICAGPDTFRARLKFRDLIEAFRNKYDPTGKSIEYFTSDNLLDHVMSRLSHQSLFATKKMYVCDGMLSKVTAKQMERLSEGIRKDGDITVVIDYEEKVPKATAVKSFEKNELFIYEHEPAKGAELNRIVADLCKRYGVDVKLVPSLIQKYQSDLWAIDTALQVICVSDGTGMVDEEFGKMDNMFAMVDWLLMDQKQWLEHYTEFDLNSVLPSALSQMRSWHMIANGTGKDVHPFVQKKLSAMRINNPDERLQQFLKAFYASRHSLASGEEIVQHIY